MKTIKYIIEKLSEEFNLSEEGEKKLKSSLTSLLDSLKKEVKDKEYDKHNPWCECLEDENMPCDCGVSHHNVLLGEVINIINSHR